jgi:Flp pilus assembly protein TadB
MVFERIYHQISAILPRGITRWASRLMLQGGFTDISPRIYVGFAVFFSFFLAVLSFFIMPFITQTNILLVVTPLGVFALSLTGFYLLLVIAADTRAERIESILPEALQIISANIRAGMTLENAVWTAARPEFGAMADEIKRVSADTYGGVPITESLTRMTSRVHSAILERSIRLINEGIRLGGEMAPLLDAVAVDIRSEQLLKKEIITSTMMYAIFIIFAAVLAAPALFSLSTFYSEMNEKVLAQQVKQSSSDAKRVSGQAGGLGALSTFASATKKRSPDSITAQDIFWFSLSNIFITTFFAALSLGLIQEGKAIKGLKYVLPFVLVSLGIYLAALGVLRGAFGTFMPP